jgi:transposase
MWMFPDLKIYLATQPTDMRKSYDGLARLVKEELNKDVFQGELFVFMSRRKDRVKCLYWDRNGFCLWSKRLEQGIFRPPVIQGKVARLQVQELNFLLEGIDLTHRQRLKTL